MEGSDSHRSQASEAHRRNTTVALVLLAVALLALLSLLLPFSRNDGSSSNAANASADDLTGLIEEKRTQVVFLSDGGLFFGQLRARDGAWFELKNAYFLRESAADKNEAASQEVSSITERLEQPESSMLLNANHVIQVENLRDDSRVAQAIKRLER